MTFCGIIFFTKVQAYAAFYNKVFHVGLVHGDALSGKRHINILYILVEFLVRENNIY